MGITSHAQNFEDVLLNRALSSIKKGFYIDVGAQHPDRDSVSKAFYEAGWSGVNIEPSEDYSQLLQNARPRDTNLNVALGDKKGELTFYEVSNTGLSTCVAEIAKKHEADGFEVSESIVPVITLDDILESVEVSDIHWLKIDVEGFEREVIRGWTSSLKRPWIIVVESTLPNSQKQVHQEWEPYLVEKGYTFTLFDGLNRFYVSNDHRELVQVLSTPANFFDDFKLSFDFWANQKLQRDIVDELIALRQCFVETYDMQFNLNSKAFELRRALYEQAYALEDARSIIAEIRVALRSCIK